MCILFVNKLYCLYFLILKPFDEYETLFILSSDEPFIGTLNFKHRGKHERRYILKIMYMQKWSTQNS